jgi:hypothetical protein
MARSINVDSAPIACGISKPLPDRHNPPILPEFPMFCKSLCVVDQQSLALDGLIASGFR